jgi:hypothetical protein
MGIFDQDAVFTTYRARITFRGKLMGGIPKDPKIIEGWLRAKAGIGAEEEIRQAMLRTLVELGADVRPDMSYAELQSASEALSAQKSTNGFKQDEGGLYLESRAIKAMLKESTNILFAGDRWGRTKKGPRSFLAERVFVNPDRIAFGLHEPSGIELFIGHVSGPAGPSSNLTYYEYVEGVTIDFDVMVAEDAIEHDHWPRIWVHAQENGIGALRSQGYGRFDIEAWDEVTQSVTRFKSA